MLCFFTFTCNNTFNSFPFCGYLHVFYYFYNLGLFSFILLLRNLAYTLVNVRLICANNTLINTSCYLVTYLLTYLLSHLSC